MLNYGHCFGHALESTSGFAIAHGQAVIVGMLFANIVAKNRGLLKPTLHHELYTQLLLPALSTRPTRNQLNPEALIDAMKMDKKRTGDGLVLILLYDDFALGKIADLGHDELDGANTELQQLLCLS